MEGIEATATDSPPTASTSAPLVDNDYEYPIVPTFGDWRFPHGRLPPEWTQQHANPPPIKTRRKRCFVTNLWMGVQPSPLIPREEDKWFLNNGMLKYCPSRNEDDYLEYRDCEYKIQAFVPPLLANIQLLFDERQFAVVPKSSAGSLSSAPPPSTPTEPRPHAFVVHVLESFPEAEEFAGLYHNVSIQPRPSPKFLFARFAWALFDRAVSHAYRGPRKLAILEKGKVSVEWMDRAQYERRLENRGEDLDGSMKRRRGPDDEDDKDSDVDMTYDQDASKERCKRVRVY
ncbi:hypothetical protein F4679DRAFT_347655 [Xylaria curta]|nr:hypothetical protein F4679DRAFT_347655 [Xylaria curta]